MTEKLRKVRVDQVEPGQPFKCVETTPAFRWYVVVDQIDELRAALNVAPTDVVVFDTFDGTFDHLSASRLVYVAVVGPPEFIVRLGNNYYWTGDGFVLMNRADAKRYPTRQEANLAGLPDWVRRSCVTIDEA